MLGSSVESRGWPAALGPFIEGLRLPRVEKTQTLRRTLTIAQFGMLPFFAVGELVVFVWTRELAGGLGTGPGAPSSRLTPHEY